MSFLRMAAKQSPLNSRMRSGKRMSSGLNTRSGRSETMSWAVSASPSMPSLMNIGVVADVELLHDEALQARGHQAVDLEADDVAAPAALERRLVGGDEVLGLLLHLDVTVAQDAEGAVAAREEAREQPRQVHADHRLDADEADRRRRRSSARVLDGQADEAHELARDRDQRVHGGAVALAPELDADGDAAVLDEGEGMRGIDGDRRQDRQILG